MSFFNQGRCTAMSVSIIIPVYNERENILPLYRQLDSVLRPLGRNYEILFVDDGSVDGTDEQLGKLAETDPRVRLVRFRRNYGQTAAMQAGFDAASGDVLVTMDGDLQNDPSDIPMMLEKLEEGFDLVHGWRRNRQDAWLHRKLPSRAANWLISRVTGFPVHDLGCTLKAVRREIAQELELVGEMHRFIPILAHQRGARCVEVVTRHHARRFGQSKYGIARTTRVLLDLVTVKFMLDYFASPMKLFGKIGIGCGVIGLLALVVTVGMKLLGAVDMTGNPLLLLSTLSVMVGVQFLSLGLLGEVNVRIYYDHRHRKPYSISRRIGFPQSSGDVTTKRAA
jgi:glycosyltransferase involved in cell wall biosynthesis